MLHVGSVPQERVCVLFTCTFEPLSLNTNFQIKKNDLKKGILSTADSSSIFYTYKLRHLPINYEMHAPE